MTSMLGMARRMLQVHRVQGHIGREGVLPSRRCVGQGNLYVVL